MIEKQNEILEKSAEEHGTPVFFIDHEKIRENYREFREKLPDVQAYFAVKANSNPEIVKTMYDMGASFGSVLSYVTYSKNNYYEGTEILRGL